MKSFSNEVVIERSLNQVTELYTNPEHFVTWHPDLEEYDTFEGTPMTKGAKTRIKYRMGKNDHVKAVEIILENDLPEKLVIRQDTDGVHIHHTSSFQSVGDSKTLFKMDSEYDTEGLMRILSFFNPGHFERQTKEFMESFKEFAEKKL